MTKRFFKFVAYRGTNNEENWYGIIVSENQIYYQVK